MRKKEKKKEKSICRFAPHLLFVSFLCHLLSPLWRCNASTHRERERERESERERDSAKNGAASVYSMEIFGENVHCSLKTATHVDGESSSSTRLVDA